MCKYHVYVCVANGAQTHSLNQYIRNCAEMADAKTRRGISRALMLMSSGISLCARRRRRMQFIQTISQQFDTTEFDGFWRVAANTSYSICKSRTSDPFSDPFTESVEPFPLRY